MNKFTPPCNSTSYLYEVIPIRLFLIVMLVFYHAFAIYSGSWLPIKGFPIIPLYSIIDKLSYACLLETFVFISGYVFGFQVRKKGENTLSVRTVFIKKFNRLIIPSIIFSMVYLLLFKDIQQPILASIYQILCGVGHMWFLPMLYWCFAIICLLEKFHIKYTFAITLLSIAIYVSFIPFPLGIAPAFYYVIFFYIGYIIQKTGYVDVINIKRLMPIALIGFILLFILKLNLKNEIVLITGIAILDKSFYIFIDKTLQFMNAFCGVVILYGISCLLVNSLAINNWERCLLISENCFGVYLFQQFILKAIYNSTLPQEVGPYILPWLAFILALLISILLTIIIRQFPLGRKLI